MDALGQSSAAGLPVPLFVDLGSDLSLYEQLRELPTLGPALERHVSPSLRLRRCPQSYSSAIASGSAGRTSALFTGSPTPPESWLGSLSLPGTNESVANQEYLGPLVG